MATIKLRDYLESLSSKGSSALNDKITILDSADGSKIKTVTKSDLVNLTFLAAELRDDFLEQYGEGTISGSIQVDHDGTTNFVANEHIDHTSITITAGNGLAGGGDISDNRTIDVVSANNGIITNTGDIELDTTSTTFTTGVKSKLNTETVVSSSAQITITNTTGFTTLSSSLQSTDNAIAARVTAVESFSSSLDSTYASDSELTAVSSALDSTDNAIAARVTAVESFSSSLDSTYASDSELTAVSSAFDSTINSLNTADVSEDSSNKYYTDVRVKTKLTAEDVVSGSNSDVKTFLAISASDISDVEAFSQSGTYASLRAQSTTAADVGLGFVDNESKATMFTGATLTGNSTAPSQSVSDNSTKIATTEFVQARITDIIGNAGSTLDTLGELSASLADDSGSLSTLTTVVGTKLAKASNLLDLTDVSQSRVNLGVDLVGTVNYVLPTDLAGDDIDIDTTPLTGATVISDLDINITTNTSGLVTDANGTVSTRELTATDLSLGNVDNESKLTMFASPTFTGTVGGVTAAHVGLGSSDNVTFNAITGSGIEITGVTNYNGLTIKAGGASRPGINFENVTQGQLGGIFGTEGNSLGLSTQGGIEYVIRNANGASGDHLFNSYNTTILKLDGATNASTFGGELIISSSQTGFATTIRNVHDSSQGLLVQSTDNDSGEYLIKLQSSNGTLLEDSADWVDRFTVSKSGVAEIGSTLKSSTYLVNRTSAAGIGTTLGDINGIELGPGYLTLARDDTADAKQLSFYKNNVAHSYLETTSTGLNIGGANVGFTNNVNIGNWTPGNASRVAIRGTGTYNNTMSRSGATLQIISDELSNDAWSPVFNIGIVRQSLTTGKDSFGGIGFTTIDDSNNSGVFDAARIALINEQPAAVLTPTALGFYTNTSPSADDTAATEKMRITSKGVIQQQDHNWSFVISKTYTSTFTMFDVQCDVGNFASCIVKIAGSKRSPGSDDHVGIKEYSCYKRSGALDWVVAEVASAGYNNDLTTTVSNTTINFISPFGGNNNFCYYSVTVIGTARDSSTKSDLRVITYGD